MKNGVLFLALVGVVMVACEKEVDSLKNSEDIASESKNRIAETYEEGTWLFGGNPPEGIEAELVLEPSHPGYNNFVNAVEENTIDDEINWDGVADNVFYDQNLEALYAWLNPGSGPVVHIYCENGCIVRPPVSCEACMGIH